MTTIAKGKLSFLTILSDTTALIMFWMVGFSCQISFWLKETQPLNNLYYYSIVICVFIFFTLFGREFYFSAVLKARKFNGVTKTMRWIRGVYIPASIANWLFFLSAGEAMEIIILGLITCLGIFLLLKRKKEEWWKKFKKTYRISWQVFFLRNVKNKWDIYIKI